MTGVSGSMQHLPWNSGSDQLLVADASPFDRLKPDSLNDLASRENLGAAWTGKDVLQFLCSFEMGKDAKHAGISKSKLMDPFLRLLSVAHEPGDSNPPSSSPPLLQQQPSPPQAPARRQRKACRPSRLPLSSDTFPPPSPVPTSPNTDIEKKLDPIMHPCFPDYPSACRNSACRRQLPAGVTFCRRCSCCICKQFDDNKDPSLWISCASESGDEDAGCGLSCHVECALKGQIAGVVRNGSSILLDGSYRCQSCGRINPLIGLWKRQLLIAKDARRVDILCYRLFLSHRLLNGTRLYAKAHSLVDEAMKRLEADVGPMIEGSAKLVRCIVNRLSCNAELQRLLSLALEEVDNLSLGKQPQAEDSRLTGKHIQSSYVVSFEDVSSSSIVVAVDYDPTNPNPEPIGYKLWHRKACERSYASSPTCVISSSKKKALLSNLQPFTEYAFKLVPFSVKGDIEGQCEAQCSTKGMEGGERPQKLHSSLDLVTSKYNIPSGDNTSCVNEGFQMKENSNGFNARSQVQNFGEGLVQQQEQARRNREDPSQNMASPTIPRGKANKNIQEVECLSPPLNVKFHSRTQVSSIHWGEANLRQVASSSLYGDVKHECRQGQNGKGEMMIRNDEFRCMEYDDGEAPGVTHPFGSKAEKGKEKVIILDTLECLQDNDLHEFCPTMGKALANSVWESDPPHQSWVVEVRSKEKGFEMETQTGMVGKRAGQCLGRAHDHINGGINSTVTSEADFNSFEFSVKVIRWLECEGHLKEDFRMKFLTWYSLSATEHERRVVSVFIDTLQDDPASLAGQLVDTFEDIVLVKKQKLTTDHYNGLWQ